MYMNAAAAAVASTTFWLSSLDWKSPELSPRTFCIFSRELSFSPVRIVSLRRSSRLLRALLIGGDPKADDQSYDHGPSSGMLRPPAARACPPHRGPDRSEERRVGKECRSPWRAER